MAWRQRRMRVRLAGIVLLSFLLGAGALSGASRPPRELHRVGDHWTAWNPPAPPPAGTGEIYVIVRGDTLWDLAKRFYGNPYLWPQLWERNQYILDAHWIYPGDPLVTGIQVAPVQNLAQAGAGAEPPATPGTADAGQPEPPPQVAGVESAVQATSAPVPLGWESDIYCSGYIADPGEQFQYTIVASEFDNLTPKLNPIYHMGELRGIYGRTGAKVDMFTGDIVYLSGGTQQGLTAGSLFTHVPGDGSVLQPGTPPPFRRFYKAA